VRFEVFMAMKIQVKVFWDVMPCSVAIGYQYFRRPCYLHPQKCWYPTATLYGIEDLNLNKHNLTTLISIL
jgi:hypothetical protein